MQVMTRFSKLIRLHITDISKNLTDKKSVKQSNDKKVTDLMSVTFFVLSYIDFFLYYVIINID